MFHQKIEDDNRRALLNRVINTNSDLPQNVLIDVFNKYLFFDADIGSSDILISTLELVVHTCFGLDALIEVYTSSDYSYLGYIDSSESWVDDIKRVNKVSLNAGNCGGLILIDSSRQWVVYQKRPIDVGVFAFNLAKKITDIEATVSDCFFSCHEIENWRASKLQPDIDIVENLGSIYLDLLFKNYSCK